MKTMFKRGRMEEEWGDARDLLIAQTPYAALTLIRGDVAVRYDLSPSDVITEDFLCEIELENLGEEDTYFIVSEIMTRRYLEKPGATDRSDSVLFTLVNEALKELDRSEAFLKRLGALEVADPETDPD